MIVSFWRIARTAFQNFWRNFWLTIATLMIMTITLLMISLLYFANIFGAEVLRSIEQKVDLSITFTDTTDQEYIDALANEVESRPDVASVRVISSDEALEIFRQRHSDDPLIEESLGELENNPLPAAMYILATDPQFYENIANHLSAERYSQFIEEVNFDQSRPVIERLIGLISSIKNIGFIVTALFASLVVLIMFNTIRLAIYGFREEIDIMRLVGASSWFVQGPFVIDAVLVALLSVVVANVILLPSLSSAAPQLQKFFFDAQGIQFDIFVYATDNLFTIIGLQTLVAVGLAVISSAVAIRRYLRA